MQKHLDCSNNWLFLLSMCCIVSLTGGSAWDPIRRPNEGEFYRSNSHERSPSITDMENKIKSLRSQRNYQPWDKDNPSFPKIDVGKTQQRPNILLMLADDLGYGDLSVAPFSLSGQNGWPCSEGNILTPNLERMAKRGLISSNFHASAPVCSPSRASIMTGIYSWRMNAMNAFELGRDPSQRNGFLPQIPTIPEMLREHGGYYTVHSGKWHLGGMREEMRIDRVKKEKCRDPSPNQHGFEEVSRTKFRLIPSIAFFALTIVLLLLHIVYVLT
jgi:hypothetical protein